MSANKKAPVIKAVPAFIFMICKAIQAFKQSKGGASRTAIANYIIKNFNKTSGGHFNASLRNAIKKGIASGVIKQGDTSQRFKLSEQAKSITNPPKKKKPKKKKAKKTSDHTNNNSIPSSSKNGKRIRNKSNSNNQSVTSHMSMENATKLKINDTINHRDYTGRVCSATIIDKNGTNLKIHYNGWSSKWDIWSDFSKELFRFAKRKSTSNNKNENINVYKQKILVLEQEITCLRKQNEDLTVRNESNNILECDTKKIDGMNLDELNELKIMMKNKMKVIEDAERLLMENTFKCVACKDNLKNISFDGCCHIALCDKCELDLQNKVCPMCQAPYNNTKKVNF